MKEIAVPKT